MIAILADIHANLEAFEAVLEDMRAKGIDNFVCLGDVIGYGPSPRECLELVKPAMFCLLGDHEKALLLEESELPERTLNILKWTFGEIFSEEYEKESNRELWFELERMAALEAYKSDEGVLFVHGSPTDPIQGVIHPLDVDEPGILDQEYDKIENLCFCGHTHLPGVFLQDEGYLPPTTAGGRIPYTGRKMIVNVGSVGYPKDRDHRACYVTYDGTEVVFHRVPYTGQAVRSRILRNQTLAEYWVGSDHMMRCLQCGVRLKGRDYQFGIEIGCPNCAKIATESDTSESRRAATGGLAVTDEEIEASQFLSPVGGGSQTGVRRKDPLVGKNLNGYQILTLIGQGGMAKVYKAKQVNLDRFVAVKLLPPELTGDEKYIQRFAREALALAKLNHPNVVIIHDFFQAEGHYFLAMEYVDGVPLSTLIQSESRLAYQRALHLARQALLGLAAAHAQSIVHRDVSPANIMVLDNDLVKLMDFGIAVSLDRKATGDTASIIGTANYMAPEQLFGTGIDWRCDLYGLGATLYQALTGVRPYDGLNMVQRRAGQGQLTPIGQLVGGVPVPAIQLVERMMSFDKLQRPKSVDEAVAAIERILAAPPPVAAAPIPAAPAPAPPAPGPGPVGIPPGPAPADRPIIKTAPRSRQRRPRTVPARTQKPAPAGRSVKKQPPRGGRIECPFCGERIRASAKICGFCRKELR